MQLDRPMLEGYRRGDHATLETLYRQLSGPVLRYLSRGFRVSGATGQAQVSPLDLDAAHQETFVRVFSESARLRYDGLKPFEPYVMAIARSAAVDVLRAQGKLQRESVPLDDLAEHDAPHDPTSSPEAAVLRAEADAVVKGFLATLSEEDLRFANARFVEGLSQEKAGAQCGLSRQEARTREARLKAACLSHLAQRGFLNSSHPTHAVVATLVLAIFHLS
jgi:RNA polymerase sigma-70 factor, ECF subfamily